MDGLRGLVAGRSPEAKLAAFIASAAASLSATGIPMACLAVLVLAQYLVLVPSVRALSGDLRLLAGFLAMYLLLVCVPFEWPPGFDAASVPYALSRFEGLAAAYLTSRVYYLSTRPSEIRTALQRLGAPFSLGGRFDPGRRMAMVLCSIPMVGRLWDESWIAFRARGGGRRLRGATGAYAFLIAGFLRRLFSISVDLAYAESARDAGRPRALPPFRFGVADGLYVAAASAVLAFAVSG